MRDGAEYNRLLLATAREGGGGDSEYRDELSGFVKESHFLNQLSDRQVLKTHRV